MELEPRTTAPAHATGAVAFVSLAEIGDDATFRLRDEGDVSLLAASIGRLGQLAPIELRPLPAAPGAGPRYQVVAGFRRLAALRLLLRERVLARVHDRLDDADAWALALAEALLTEALDETALAALGERLRGARVAPWAEELLDEARVRAPIAPELRERFWAFLERGGGEATDAAAGAWDAEDASAGVPAAASSAPADLRTAAAGGAPWGAAAGDAAEGAAGADDFEVTSEVEVTPEELATDLAARMYSVNQDLVLAAESWADLPAEGRREILAQARWVATLLAHLDGRAG